MATYKSLTKKDRFHGNFGTCFDGLIERELNYFVPKHKSYLKLRDLNARAGKLAVKNTTGHDLKMHQSEAEILGE